MSAGERAATYAARHPDSPIAHACEATGAVRVDDHLRAELLPTLSTSDLRAAYALGVISATGGLPADVHQQDSGLWPDLTHPGDYLAKWIATALSWRHGKGWAEREREEWPEYDDAVAMFPAAAVVIPPAVAAYLARLVHAPKAEYARRVVDALIEGKAPPRSDAAWSADVVRKVERALRRQA